MAILETGEIFLKAVITRRGKEILAKNNERFIITKFALGDDEINYALVDDNNDPDGNAMESLSVFEPTTNSKNVMKSKLIRNADNLQAIAQANQYKQVPLDELQIKTQVSGNTTFSLNNWIDDSCMISFSIYSPVTANYFLGQSFIIDASDFWNKHGFSFDFIPIFPTAVIGQPNKYWFVSDETYKDSSGNVMPVIVGINNDHKPITGLQLSDVTNDLNIPALTFKLKLRESDVRGIFMKLMNTKTTFLDGDIVITNGDKTVVPTTGFYGNGASYSNISTKVKLSVTF